MWYSLHFLHQKKQLNYFFHYNDFVDDVYDTLRHLKGIFRCTTFTPYEAKERISPNNSRFSGPIRFIIGIRVFLEPINKYFSLESRLIFLRMLQQIIFSVIPCLLQPFCQPIWPTGSLAYFRATALYHSITTPRH